MRGFGKFRIFLTFCNRFVFFHIFIYLFYFSWNIFFHRIRWYYVTKRCPRCTRYHTDCTYDFYRYLPKEKACLQIISLWYLFSGIRYVFVKLNMRREPWNTVYLNTKNIFARKIWICFWHLFIYTRMYMVFCWFSWIKVDVPADKHEHLACVACDVVGRMFAGLVLAKEIITIFKKGNICLL